MDRCHIPCLLVRLIKRLVTLFFSSTPSLRLSKFETPLTCACLFAYLALMLEPPDVRAAALLLLVRVIPSILSRMQVAQEESHSRCLYLGMRVRTSHSQQCHRSGICPNVPTPHLRGHTDCPQCFCAALEFCISAMQYNVGTFGVHATLYHTKQKTLDHAVETWVLGLLVRML